MTVPSQIPLRRALIVEDEAASQRRLKALLAAVAGGDADMLTVDGVAAAQAAVQAQAFDIALVDVGLPDGNGVELIAWIQARQPGVACVVITGLGDEETVLAALRAGAIGYLLKERDDAELILALHNIQRGGAPIDPFVARRILALLADAGPTLAPSDDAGLSGRECDILKRVAHGHSNRQIAASLGLSRFTVEDYTKAIYRKLAVGSRTEAVFKAQSQGLLG